MSNTPSASLAQNPVALVTGANDRIGACLAKTLASSGYAVIVHYRSDPEGANRVKSEIIAAGGRAEVLQANLADRAQRSEVIAKAGEPFGPLTLLINNASIFERDSIFDVSEELWDKHFVIHAEVPVFLSRDFATQLPEGASGNIINILDERVLHPTPGYFSYYLSKAVLWTATQTMAQSLAPAIRVNAIGPGPVLPNSRQTQAEFEESLLRLPLHTSAGPQEIAEGVLAILSMRSYTGQMLALDGGEHLSYLPESGLTRRK
jgi:NAD(P)-dependent dehydrogenase (short-subunit alcohol dehydrogenase family)